MKVGDRLKVVANVSKHGFQIGEKVEVDEIVKQSNTPICVDGKGKSYALHDSEYEVVWEV